MEEKRKEKREEKKKKNKCVKEEEEEKKRTLGGEKSDLRQRRNVEGKKIRGKRGKSRAKVVELIRK